MLPDEGERLLLLGAAGRSGRSRRSGRAPSTRSPMTRPGTGAEPFSSTSGAGEALRLVPGAIFSHLPAHARGQAARIDVAGDVVLADVGLAEDDHVVAALPRLASALAATSTGSTGDLGRVAALPVELLGRPHRAAPSDARPPSRRSPAPRPCRAPIRASIMVVVIACMRKTPSTATTTTEITSVLVTTRSCRERRHSRRTRPAARRARLRTPRAICRSVRRRVRFLALLLLPGAFRPERSGPHRAGPERRCAALAGPGRHGPGRSRSGRRATGAWSGNSVDQAGPAL